MGGDLQRLRWCRVAGEDDLAALSRWSHHLLGGDAGDGLAALQAAEVGTGLDAEALRESGVEVPGSWVLGEDVAERGVAFVVDRDGMDAVALALDGLARFELGERQLIGQAPERDVHAAHQLGEPARAVDRPRLLALAQGQ